MQRIDSFFKRVPNQKKSDEDSPPAPKKRKARVISSDEEEEISESPQVSTNKKPSKKTRVEQKSPQDEPTTSKKPSLSKLKSTPKRDLVKIDPSALFGGETKRVEAKRPPKPKEAGVIELEDEDINQSLMEIDLDESIRAQDRNSSKKDQKQQQEIDGRNNHKNGKPEKSTPPSPAKQVKLQEVIGINNHTNGKPEKLTTPSPAKRLKLETVVGINTHKDNKVGKVTPPSPGKRLKLETVVGINTHKDNIVEKVTPPSPPAKQNGDLQPKSTPKATTPRTKKKHVDLESSVLLTDEDRYERRRMSAVLYQKYKNRSSCLNHGCKEVPKGKPDCLKGLTFLVTGVLESLERDEACAIIKEYGGKTMTVVGKKLNYLIAGEDSGPKKLAQADEFNIPVLSEDDLFDLIRKRSGDQSVKTSDGDDDGEKPSTSSNNKNLEKTKIKIKKEEINDEHVVLVSPKKDNVKEKPIIKKEEKVTPKNEDSPNNEKPKVSDDMLAWVDKYKPTSVKQIIGQQGAASNVTKLTNWLSKWYINHNGKKKLQRPNPWAKNDDGSSFKAALLSGPPGIGKTTTATLVCKELGFDAVEFNASDTRSKRLLKEEVSELLSNKSLFGYFHGNGGQAVTKKHVLIMDEVDGMAGNEDRGGMQELIALIKESSVPIICMCNDRNHQKMRSLVNYCYDLRFNRPRLEQIKGCIMSICFKEKIKIEPAKLEELIAATNNDIRQSINHISLLSAGKELNLKSDNVQSGEKIAQKDFKLGPWEVVRKVLSANDHKHMSINDKSDLFFEDYSLAPLFVQQNYLKVSPVGPKSEVMDKVAAAADALSLGDLVDKRIRSSAAWSLLPTQAMFSSVLPGTSMAGNFIAQISFPGWLGKNSRATKRSRLAQEIHDHTRIRTSGSRMSIRLDYAPFLLDNIVRPLREKGMEGVEESLNVIKEYHLLREDIESLIELTTWPGKKSPMDAVDSRVKATLTRAYNKEVMPYTYSVQVPGVKKKQAEAAVNDDELMMEDEEGSAAVIEDSADEDENDDLESDGLIKAKKKNAASSSASSKAASSSKSAGSKKTVANKPKSSSAKAKK